MSTATTRPVVSVIVPVFQQEPFVADAIESLIGQTLQNIEIICIDDGSTDGSADIIASIDDDRVVLLRRSNGGPSAAINEGMLRARGKFIALLGGDDVAEPWRLSLQVEIAEARRADLVFSLPTLIDANGIKLHDAAYSVFFDRKASFSTPGAVFRQLVVGANFLCAPTALFCRELVQSVGLFRDEYIQTQDFDYWLRAAAAGKCFAMMQPRVTRYRRHDGNLSSKNPEAALGELVHCLLRNLRDAPAALFASAFPDMLPPGKTEVTSRDRAMVTLMNPLATAIGIALTMDAFGGETGAENSSMKELGTIISSALAPRIRMTETCSKDPSPPWDRPMGCV